jgi:hypothetical protein
VANPQLMKKLLLKPGMRVLVINAPSRFLEDLGPLPEGALFAEGPDGTLDFVQLFVLNSEQYRQMSRSALRAVKPDGLLWICYPKKSAGVESDLDREVVWKLLEPAGLRPVTQIAIDEVWSALRFRPIDKVKQA